MLDHLVGFDRAPVEHLDQGLVLVDQRALDLAGQDRGVQQILDPDAHPGHLVPVGRPDAPAGGADLGVAQEAFGDLVQGHVVGRDDVRVGADQQPRGVHTTLDQAVHLPEQDLEVDHHAVADDRCAGRGQDPAGQQVQRELRIADDHGVPGVVAALVAHDIVRAATEQVGGLALALVAPLGAHDDDRRHSSLLRPAPRSSARPQQPPTGSTATTLAPRDWPHHALHHRSGTQTAGSMMQAASPSTTDARSSKNGAGVLRISQPVTRKMSAPVRTVRRCDV